MAKANYYSICITVIVNIYFNCTEGEIRYVKKCTQNFTRDQFPRISLVKAYMVVYKKNNVALLQTTGFLTKETDESFCPFMLDFTLLLSSPF